MSGSAGLLVAPLVFRAPEGPAAREARRPHFVRRRASKPARALRSLRRPPRRRRRVAVCAGGWRPARSPSAPRAVACCPDRSPAAARPARPLAVRAASFARRVVSKPGQAPPPPTGTAARALRTSGALHTSGACGAVVSFGASSRSPARPCHRPRAPQPARSGPSGGLHASGALRAVISGRSFACCYKRRQSKAFFEWFSDPLLQTSSIQRLFRRK